MIYRIMEYDKNNIGLTGLALGLVIAMRRETMAQIAVGILVPLSVLVIAHFLKRELDYRFPPKRLKNKDEDLVNTNSE